MRRSLALIAWWLATALLVMLAACLGERADDFGGGDD
jgi:hypothetical protein